MAEGSIDRNPNPTGPDFYFIFHGFVQNNIDTSKMYIHVNATAGFWKNYDREVRFCDWTKPCDNEAQPGSQIRIKCEKIYTRWWERVFDLQVTIWSQDPEIGVVMCIIGKVDLDAPERKTRKPVIEQEAGD